MKIAFSAYALQPKSRLNAVSKSQERRKGFLLRFEFENSWGYSACHPWPELGDPTVAEQFESLKKFKSEGQGLTTLLEQSFYFAQVDAEFRAEKKNIFLGLAVPRSHFLISDLADFKQENFEERLGQGFQSFKIKIGTDLKSESQQIQNLFTRIQPDIQLRLDANGTLDLETFVPFWQSLSGDIQNKIQFVEDPVSFEQNPKSWLQLRDSYKIPLAKDFEPAPKGQYDFLILKPAAQKTTQLQKEWGSIPLVVTSYMDHPLGQAQAAWAAAQLSQSAGLQVKECGLLSHHSYEKNEFSECLSQKGPEWLPPPGQGFGFDDLLEKQTWTEI